MIRQMARGGRRPGVPVAISMEWRGALRRWLDAHGRGAGLELARATGASAVTISEIVRGTRKSAHPEILSSISAHTGIGLPETRDEATHVLFVAVERARAAGLPESEIRSLAEGLLEAAKKLEAANELSSEARKAVASFLPKKPADPEES